MIKSKQSKFENIVNKVLKIYWKQVEEYKAGKERVFGFFVDKVMGITG